MTKDVFERLKSAGAGMGTRNPRDYSFMLSVADAVCVGRRLEALESALREIRTAAIAVGDGETREALEHCAFTAMDVTSRILVD